MNNLYEILEICLQEIEEGAELESVLFRYPEFSEELRPILETSVKAREMAASDPTPDVVRRNRAKLLQQAAQMREANVKTSRRFWSVPLRRAMVSLVVVAALFMSGTGLVGAASTTLPGDNLYPVKRTWEDVLVLFTFNIQLREQLEVEHENKRLDELNELFAEGRSTEVEFAGVLTRQNPDLWLVAGIPVAISAQTELPTQSIVIGDAIRVKGITQKDGAVLAEEIELLPAGVPLPQVNDDDSFEFEQDHSGSSNQDGEDNSGKGSEGEAPEIEESETPQSESGSGADSDLEKVSLAGTVQSINGNILVVNGQIMNMSSAEIKGTPQAGASAKVEGYYSSDGLFIVTKIEFQDGGSNSGNSSGSDDNGNDDGSNDNNNDSNDDDSNDNASNDDNGGDDSGGDNSGSGGGGDD